jgi:hypothetical protein
LASGEAAKNPNKETTGIHICEYLDRCWSTLERTIKAVPLRFDLALTTCRYGRDRIPASLYPSVSDACSSTSQQS